MIKEYLEGLILHNFGFTPTNQQAEVVKSLAEFILAPTEDEVFLLRGYAGTGKTSLIGALVKTMREVKSSTNGEDDGMVLMAPTGRSAKVFSLYADHAAYTIHKRIYRQKSIDKDSIFDLNFNMKSNLLFIVDEASMISNDNMLSGVNGGLLDDLVHFVYNGKGCRLLIMGDTAQLPPVGEGESPALQKDMLEGYGLSVRYHSLTQVVRQADASGILWNATHLRQLIDMEDIFDLPKIKFAGFHDVKNISGSELIEELGNCYNRYGQDETIVICRSNKRAHVYNNGIRSQILWREDELTGGDMLMIAKNNYFWTEGLDADFIANGDIAVVERVRNEREFYGFRFADCQLRLPDYDDLEIEATVLLDTLHAEAPALTREQQDILYNKVLEDYQDIPLKKDRLKALKQDPYFNALQIKYAYAITCHKAQGGQWGHVFVDQGYMTEDMLGPEYFRWLYTAITRATDTVYFVNWREEQTLV